MTKLFTKVNGTAALLTSLAVVPALAQNSMSDWNSDGVLSDDEFETGAYHGYDADDSGAIEEPEFSSLNDDMGDGGFWDA